ncbi:MAG: glycosyltransferase [bacterium]
MPRVSVIVVTWSAKDTVKDTIDSILAQTFTDFELLIMDNKSVDGTLEIVECYKDPRIKITKRSANTGSPVKPRNEAMTIATGEWIAFCDADDIWAPDKLEKQLLAYEESKEKEDIGMIYTGAKIIDMGGNQIDTNPALFSGFVPNTIARRRLLYGDFITTCSVIFKRTVFTEFGPMDEALVGIDDYEYFLRITKEYGLLALPELLCSWRLTGENLSGDKASQYQKDEVIFEKLEREEPDNKDVLVGHGKNLTRIFLALVLEKSLDEAGKIYPKILKYPTNGKISVILWFWGLSPRIGVKFISFLSNLGLVKL